LGGLALALWAAAAPFPVQAEQGDLGLLEWLDDYEPEAFTDVILMLGARYDHSEVIRRQIIPAAAPDPRTPRFVTVSSRDDTIQSVIRDIVSPSDDYVMNLQLFLFDEREVADSRLRSDLYVYGDAHGDGHDLDYSILSGRTGPVFDLGESWQIHTAMEGSVSLYDYEPFSLLGAGDLTLQSRTGRFVRSIHLRAGGEHFSSGFGNRDAWFADLTMSLASEGILRAGDWLQLAPGVTRNQARESRFRYSQAGAALRYEAPLIGRLTGSLGARAWRRLYDGHASEVETDRRDWHLINEVTLSYTGLFSKHLSLEVRYEFEKNWSNDDFEDYDGYSTGVFLVWQR
jgi:hypothetical protein